MEQVKLWWMFYSFAGFHSFILAHKLKALKNDLKNGMMRFFATLRSRKRFFWMNSKILILIQKEDP